MLQRSHAIQFQGRVSDAEVTLSETDILQSSEIVVLDNESSERLVVPIGRITVTRNEGDIFGFKTIDIKIPLDTTLSRYINIFNESAWQTELNPDKFSIKNFKEDLDSSQDILERTAKFNVLFNEWIKKPQYQYYTVRNSSKGTKISIKAKKKKVLVMGSNDYLNLSCHPEVIEAGKHAISTYGSGSTGSPLTTGITEIHEQLSEFLAKLLRKEKVILFNSGYSANLGAIQGLTNPHDLVTADIISHASIQDAMKLSNAKFRFFPHNSVESLEYKLSKDRDKFQGSLVVTEAIFSMDGDSPPLEEIIKVSKKYDSRIYLDEAHSIGVLGESGGGLVEELSCHDNVDIIMGTFSKSFGSIGGFIASSKNVCNYLYWLARSHMFSVSMTPASAASVLKAGEIFTGNPEIIQKLRRNIKQVVEGLRDLGAPLSPHHKSTVVPFVVGDIKVLGKMNEYLMDHGVFVVPIIYPAVSIKKSRFRITVNAGLSESDIDYVLLCFKHAMKEADFGFNK